MYYCKGGSSHISPESIANCLSCGYMICDSCNKDQYCFVCIDEIRYEDCDESNWVRVEFINSSQN